MKKLLAFGIAALIAPVAMGQGQINFNDFSNPDVLSGGALDGTLAGSSITATIWWGTTSDPLTFVEGPSTAYVDNAGVPTGALFGGQTVITGSGEGQAVFVQIRSAGLGYSGEGGVVQRTLGGGVNPVPNIPSEVITLTPIPEPSTFALAGLGASALLIFRRRD